MVKSNRYRLTLRFSYWNELCALLCAIRRTGRKGYDPFRRQALITAGRHAIAGLLNPRTAASVSAFWPPDAVN